MDQRYFRRGRVRTRRYARMRTGLGATVCAMTNTASESVRISAHAVDRYRERIKPGLDEAAARSELERLRAVGTVVREPPTWLHAADHAPCYLLFGDDIALPLLRHTDGGWIASTCVPKSTLTSERRQAKTARRRSLAARARAQRRAPF